MTLGRKPKALFIRVGRSDLHWWWHHVDHDGLRCELHCRMLPLAINKPKGPFTTNFLLLAVRTAKMLLEARRERFAYVFTFENDWLTFLIASYQTLFWVRQPRHVILQFIMRERRATLRSRLKYAFMRWCFRSVHLVVCSSRPEGDYYLRAFGWPRGKVAFVPIHTDPAFFEQQATEEPFVVAAGRTFRDYPTLLEAARNGLDLPLHIVAGRGSLDEASVPPGVTVHYDIPFADLIGLLSRAAIVALPLMDREISTGQSVLLEAMSMGKPVVVTCVNGTRDYVDHMRTGLLVPAKDPSAMREAINRLAREPELRRRIGAAARAEVLHHYMPNDYALGVARVLKELR